MGKDKDKDELEDLSPPTSPRMSRRKRWVTRFRSVATRQPKEPKIRLKEKRKGPQQVVVPWFKKKFLDRILQSRLVSWIPFLRREPTEGEREMYVNDHHRNRQFKYRGNSISTTKYGPITFLPKNLFEQFKRLANLWFLIVACVQLIPGISPLNPAASIVPLVFVLSVTAVKEAFEDIKRRISDTRVNGQQVLRYEDGKFSPIAWRKVKVGDVLKILNNEPIPADIVLLTTSDKDGLAYIETANLDGETNLKVRQALEETLDALQDESKLKDLNAAMKYERPNPELYSFSGAMKIEGESTELPINLEQTLWRGCTLRNTEWAIGVVIFTGMDSKVMKNARQPPSKRSRLEQEMNQALLTIFIFAIVIDFIAALIAGIWTQVEGYDHWYLDLEDIQSSAAVIGLESFAAWLILCNVIIPISLYVYMEMVKIVMVFWINGDIEMYHAETNTPAHANTSNLAEELGQIEYIFSDKTGTLTANEMFFMRCSIAGKAYGDPDDRPDDQNEDQRKLEKEEEQAKAKIERDEADGDKKGDGKGDGEGVEDEEEERQKQKDKREEAYVFRDPELLADIHSDSRSPASMFFRILGVCHTVLVDRHGKGDDDENENGDGKDGSDSEDEKKSKGRRGGGDGGDGEDSDGGEGEGEELVYQAASPDEAALVEAARSLGFEFCGRDNNSVFIRVHGVKETWKLLNVLEFNSDRKRMSVIVEDPEDGSIKLFCKGADTMIYDRLGPGDDDLKETTMRQLEAFAAGGLRTLCVAQKTISQSEYAAWSAKYNQAALLIQGREAAIDAVAEEIETDLELVGATAIEDRLQDGVPEAISTLLSAGLKMWVLTGDKMETAINIGYSCSLLSNDMNRMIFSSEPFEGQKRHTVKDRESAIRTLEYYIHKNFPDMPSWTPPPEDPKELEAEKEKEKEKKDAKAGSSSDSDEEEGNGHKDEDNSSDSDEEEEEEDEEDEKGEDDDESKNNQSGSSSKKKEHAMVIDGKSLARFVPSKGPFTPLSARFLALAMKCKVVICCRVSPLQKALVVRLVKKGIRVVTLAIGDGANDVPMIQEAQIGIGISGKEGRQAVMASDYSIAQFRFLVPLLLVHGHWSYRRMCVLLLYSFYKNMIFALTNWWFGIYSAFAAQSLFDSWAVSVYNILYTGLPILMVAIFDQASTREQIYQYPRIYERGIRGKDFSKREFWGWQILGILQSIIITFFGMLAYWNWNTASNGRVLDLFSMGNTIMTSVILVVSIKIIFITHTWTIFNHLALYISVFFWFLFLIVYTLIPENFIISPNDLYYNVYNMMSTAVFWLTPLVTAAACCVPDLAYIYLSRTYFPPSDQIVAELAMIDKRRPRKKGARRLVDRALFKPVRGMRKSRRKGHTGYAFSQAAGARDLLFSLGLAPVPSGDNLDDAKKGKKQDRKEASKKQKELEKEKEKEKERKDSSSESESESESSSEGEEGLVARRNGNGNGNGKPVGEEARDDVWE